MDIKWRPDGWENPYKKSSKEDFGLGETLVYGWEYPVFEAGADAMLEALFKLAKESPTRTFTIDSRAVTIYEDEEDNVC